MIRRLLDLLLIALILVGGYRSWQSGQQRTRLRDTQKRLEHITGILPITDPARVHIVALETGNPMHFAWRMYLPQNYHMRVADNHGSSSSGTVDATEFIARVRFREDNQGRLEIHEHMKFSSGRSNLGSRELTTLLRGRWDKLQVEQLGAPEMAVLDADESAVLLRLSLPDDLATEARKTLDSYTQKQSIPVFYELRLGPNPPAKP